MFPNRSRSPSALALLILTIGLPFPTSVARGQCPGGNCAISSITTPGLAAKPPARPANAQPEYEWYPLGGINYLYRNGRLIGAHRPGSDRIMPYLADAEWCKTWPPVSPPAASTTVSTLEPDGTQNFGLDLGKLRENSRLAYHFNGREVSPREAFAAVEAQLTDDSGRLGWVVGVGAPADKLAKDWTTAATLTPFADSFALQTYQPADAMAKALGYTADGVYVVTNDSAKGPLPYSGPDELGGLLDRIKNPKAPLIQPVIDTHVSGWVWLVLAAVVGVWLGRRQSK